MDAGNVKSTPWTGGRMGIGGLTGWVAIAAGNGKMVLWCMERHRMDEAWRRARSCAQSCEVLARKCEAEQGKSEVTRDNAAVEGTMTRGSTQDRGFRVGRVRASDGRPGSMESQVEQTVASGWALRPESGRVTEAVKERMGVAQTLGRGNSGPSDGRVEISVAGQLVKATRSTKASIGSSDGAMETVMEWLAGPSTTRDGGGTRHLVAWLGKVDAA